MEERPLWDPSETDETTTDPAEGVRLIGADEAAEALERGEVASRRGEESLRYGDRPPSPDDGVRPTLRFPLGRDESGVDLVRPRVSAPAPVPIPDSSEGASRRWAADEAPPVVEHRRVAPDPEVLEPAVADDREPGPADPIDLREPVAEPEVSDAAARRSGPPDVAPRWRDQPLDLDDADVEDASMLDDEESTVNSSDEPDEPTTHDLDGSEPTGTLFDEDATSASGADLRAVGVRAVGTAAPTVDGDPVPDDRSVPEPEPAVVDHVEAAGTAPSRPVDDADVEDGDVEDEDRVEEDAADREADVVEFAPSARPAPSFRPAEPDFGPTGGDAVGSVGARPAAEKPLPEVGTPGVGEHGGGAKELPPRDVRLAIVSGLALAAAALGLFWLGEAAATVLVTVVAVVCSAELFSALRRSGYQPATLLGLVATAGLVTAAYWRGETAIPIVLGLTVVVGLLWYLIGVTRLEPTMNAGVSILAVAYVGLLASFATLLLRNPNGRGLVGGIIIAVVANDVCALVVGRRFGKRLVAPQVSPAKTVEGLVGGGVASVAVSVLLIGSQVGPLGMHPWDLGSALALGAVVAVMAPLGDLCESMIKRDLGIKDMSAIIPGHGGVLDRVDALLFCLPAVYYLTLVLDLT